MKELKTVVIKMETNYECSVCGAMKGDWKIEPPKGWKVFGLIILCSKHTIEDYQKLYGGSTNIKYSDLEEIRRILINLKGYFKPKRDQKELYWIEKCLEICKALLPKKLTE